MKAILSFLVILLLFSLFSYSVYAQDVFNPSDPIYTYNASSPQGSNTNPATPAANTMAKWVRTAGRINWDATKFKCYYFNGMAFRLRFPNNYNPNSATKYPVVVFYHGGGESAPVTDNEDHLYWGAQLFEQRINAGEWNGFLLFPQQTTVGWDDSYFSRVNNVLDTLQKYNRLDPDKTISMGLSSGGYGAVAYAQQYPQRVASCISSSPAFISSLNYNLGNFVQVPIWIANGGVDQGPDPYETSSFMDAFRNAGGNFYQTYLADEGHITWNFQWNLKNPANQNILTNWWNGAHKAQPLVYYGNNSFCNGAINARLGITAGYAEYEWQQESGGVFSTIGGAQSNELQVTQGGRYRVRFKRDAAGAWSDWTPNPVTIAEKTCSADTLFAERFDGTSIYYQADQAYKPYSFGCQNGVITSSTYNISQDGPGKTGGYFLLHNTSTNCSYTANDEVWHAATVMSVTPNTNYEYVFYLANRSTTNNAKIVPKINGGLLPGGFVQATGSGNGSWKKFRFVWNSGDATYADIALVNQTTSTSGNDFAIDDISFGLPAPVVNQPPVARAGNDIVITSPASTATLNGTASTDADGTITTYAWSKIDGPAQYAIANAGAATTGISNLVQGVYSFQLIVTDNSGASSADTVNVTVNPNTQPVCGAVPAGITSSDVSTSLLGLGAIANGSTCFTAPGTYTIKGAGDLSSSSDKFRFVYRTLSGNGTMTVKITSQDEVNELNKAGLMFRESLNNGAPYAFMGLTSGDGAYLQSQVPGLLGLFTTVSTTRYGAGTVKAPYYVRLTRSGSTFTGAVSADGVSWTTVGSKTVSMNTSVYVGLAVCSRSNTTLSQAIFDNWTIVNAGGQQVMRTSAETTATASTESSAASIIEPITPITIINSELKVYPNPAVSSFIVDFSVDKKQTVSVSITGGGDGRVWYTESISNFSGHYRKDLGSLRLPKGTYGVTVRTAAGVKTSILVKQ